MDKEIKALDIGTMNLIGASLMQDATVQFKSFGHAFFKLQIDSSMIAALKEEGVEYVGIGRDLYAVGNSATRMAAVMGKAIRRPMHNGILDPGEEKAEVMMKFLMELVIGKAQNKDAVCYFSVPAEPVESEHRVVYHTELIEEFLNSLGYHAHAVNEGQAVVYNGLAARGFTGIGISCGGGAMNVCLAHNAVTIDAFSIDRGGDWIDDNVSKVVSLTPGKVKDLKDKGVDLITPKTRVDNAIAIYYKDMIRYAVERMVERLERNNKLSLFKEPVDIEFAGGAALPTGFVPLFKEELAKVHFPLTVGQVALAQDPARAVVRGCLIAAMGGVA